MRRLKMIIVATAAMLLPAAASGQSYRSTCADCHFARPEAPAQDHLFNWEHSLHGRNNVGCEKCHGGNASTFEQLQAHAGLLTADAVKSPVNRRNLPATCGACHDRAECVACHQGVTKPVDFHPGNYVLAHAVDARRGTPDCSACHRAQSFCVGCHERSGVGRRAITDYNTVDPERAFHPAGWASATGGPNRHALEARRSIASCASCHRDDECLECHSAQPGSIRASPHPRGWRNSARCRALDRGNRRMCLRCHVTQDEVGCDWRAM